MNIPLSSPDLDSSDRAAVLQVLQSPTLSLGPKVPEFEEAAALVAGTRYAVAVNSGTSGLHLCVRAAGIRDGDEVITTSFSFIASANCLLFERAKPIFVDIDPLTYNIVPQNVEAAITSRTKAVLPVHVFGRPCAMDRLLDIADRRGLTVIEDACEAVGARYRNKRAGSFGEMGVFAFYPNKQITTGEGGMIVTDNAAIAQDCRSMRNQGRSEDSQWLAHDRLGFNYRISDINCALGIPQLRRTDQILRARAAAAALYDQALRSIPEVIPPVLTEPDCDISWFVYVVRLQDEFTAEDRDNVLLELRKRGVQCRNYFPPIHLQPLYRTLFGYRPGMLPVTERIADRTIALPFFNRITESQIRYVCDSLKSSIALLRHNLSAIAAAGD